MEFKLPIASKKNLEKLLNYLGNTKNYSKYYKGNRADDFRKCFDIESEWCLKYADLMIRGLEDRKLEYGEAHHIVPRVFYNCGRYAKKGYAGNIAGITFAEHLYAHYCLVKCSIESSFTSKMASAFLFLFRLKNSKSRPEIPSEEKVLDMIQKNELSRILNHLEAYRKVELEGRTHKNEDPEQYYKDYREANKQKISAMHKAWSEANKDILYIKHKKYRETNKETIAAKKKAYREANKEMLAAKNKAYREANKETIAAKKKAYQEANKEIIATKQKAYWEANKKEISKKRKERRISDSEYRDKDKARGRKYHELHKEEQNAKSRQRRRDNREKYRLRDKAYYEKNKEKISEREKAYREANKERIIEYRKKNKEKLQQDDKARYAAKRAAGYAKRTDPITGKRLWVYVGKTNA